MNKKSIVRAAVSATPHTGGPPKDAPALVAPVQLPATDSISLSEWGRLTDKNVYVLGALATKVSGVRTPPEWERLYEAMVTWDGETPWDEHFQATK